MIVNAVIAGMAETNKASDDSLLWGRAIEFWDRLGITALIWGAVLGVAALLLTAASAYILYRVADVAQKNLEAESKASTEKIVELTTRAEDLRKGTAETNARALEAQVALEKYKAPRSISQEQRDRITEQMKKFAGQEYFGMVASGSADAWDVWREVSLSLELAGWTRIEPQGSQARQYGPPAGIAVAPLAGVMTYAGAGVSTPQQTMMIYERAKALAAKLTDESIVAGAGFAADIARPQAIAIVIGPKP